MEMFDVRLTLAGLFSVMLLLCGCGSSTAPSSGKPKIVATIFPLADWAREVAGPDAEIHLLVSGAANPHHFEPGIRDVTSVTEANAIFAVGLGLDPWAKKLAQNADGGAVLFETGAWIKPRKLDALKTIEIGHDHDDHDDDHHHEGSEDPHYWLDPQRAAAVATRMAEELGKIDAAHKDAYAQRAGAYVEKLKALDAEIRTVAKTVKPGTQLVAFHDAYGYLFERLGIKLAVVVQVSPGVEPGLRDVSEAIRIMKEIGQKTVFKEPAGSASAAKLVAQELSAQVETLDPMDSEQSDVGKTYLERLKHDIDILAKTVKP
jgi:zinc transport system substrate-binding protein